MLGSSQELGTQCTRLSQSRQVSPDSWHWQVALCSGGEGTGGDGGDSSIAGLEQGAHRVPDSRRQEEVDIEFQGVVGAVLYAEGGVHSQHLQSEVL